MKLFELNRASRVEQKYYPGWVVSVVRLKLSQTNLAGVGAGAELGNM